MSPRSPDCYASRRETSRSRSRSTRRITSSLISPVLRSSTTACRSASISSRRSRWYFSDRFSILPSPSGSMRAEKRSIRNRYWPRSPLGRVVEHPRLADQLVEALERRLGRADPRERLLGVGAAVVLLQPQRADHERQRQALHDERREHDGEREEDDQVAAGKRRAGVGVQRDEQRRRDRHGSAHAVPGDERGIAPRRRRIVLAERAGSASAAGRSPGRPRRSERRSPRARSRPRRPRATSRRCRRARRGSGAAAARPARTGAR